MPLMLMVVFAAFAIGVVGVLAIVYARETKGGVLTTTEIDDLKKRLEATPRDEALKEEIRQKDLRAREAYFAERRRFGWGGCLLLAAAVGWVASARWFFALAPKKPPALTDPRAPASLAGARGALAVACVAGAVFLGLAYTAGFYRGAALLSGWTQTPETPSASISDGAETSEDGAPSPTPRAAASKFKQNWPCFRGPDNLGLAGPGDWPTTWSVATGRNILWKTPVPLPGKSSPVVWGDRIFLTSANESEQHVLCFDRETGALLWDKRVRPPRPGKRAVKVMEDTGFAASTPATDGTHVFAMFAAGYLVAFDFEGRQVWVKDFGELDNLYGFAASLLVHEGILILQLDQGAEAEDELSELIGFQAATGELAYGVPRPVPNSWASPSIIRTPERTELITCGDPYIIAYDPVEGAELWLVEGLEGDVAPSIAFDGKHIYATQDLAYLMAIRPGGEDEASTTQVTWQSEDGLPDTSSPVTDGERLLLVAAGGLLTCVSAADGETLWDKYLESGATASPILAGGRTYLACEDGVTRVIELADEYRLIDTGDIGEGVSATPAFADSKIYIRGAKHLICVGEAQ